MKLFNTPLPRLRSLESWERALVFLWLAQFSVSLGFSFYYPFIPLFIQDLGIEDPGQAALWAGIATALAVYLLNGLHFYNNDFPGLPTTVNLAPLFAEAPWRAVLGDGNGLILRVVLSPVRLYSE